CAREAQVFLRARQATLVEHHHLAVPRHQLDGGVVRAAEGMRGGQLHEGSPVPERPMRAAISSVAVPSSRSAFCLSPRRYARSPSASVIARLTFTPLSARSAQTSGFLSRISSSSSTSSSSDVALLFMRCP